MDIADSLSKFPFVVLHSQCPTQLNKQPLRSLPSILMLRQTLKVLRQLLWLNFGANIMQPSNLVIVHFKMAERLSTEFNLHPLCPATEIPPFGQV